LDFTSALYLGIDHDWFSLAPWTKLSLGKPAALQDPPGAAQAEAELAALTGCEAALLAPSTLHLFVDLLPILARPEAAIFIDRHSYRMAWWGAAQAAAAGVRCNRFGPNDPEQLERLLARSRRLRPIVISDGLCIATGRTAPLAEYAELAARRKGVLVIDDTQALGIYATITAIRSHMARAAGARCADWD
jgi:8-amino-7-oxononanoate synthase